MTDRRPPVPRLHAVTDDEVLARDGWLDNALALVGSLGSSIALHVRGPRRPGARVFELVSALREPAERSGALLVVNDRIDVVLAANAPGVHLGHRSLSLPTILPLLPPSTLRGVSCHTPYEVSESGTNGADYVFAGTIFSTPSHPDRLGVGVDGLDEMVRAGGGLPVLAIGGIDRARVGSVMEAGAHGVAVVRGVWDAEDPVAGAMGYIRALEKHVDGDR